MLSIYDIDVMVTEEKAYVSSKEVAKRLGMSHDSVLKDIRNICESTRDEFVLQNFETYKHLDMCGKSHEEVLLTRDGFSLLTISLADKDVFEQYVNFLKTFNHLRNPQSFLYRIVLMKQHGLLKEVAHD